MTRQERERAVLDLYYNQRKSVREIAKEARMSFRDIGTILNKTDEGQEQNNNNNNNDIEKKSYNKNKNRRSSSHLYLHKLTNSFLMVKVQ